MQFRERRALRADRDASHIRSDAALEQPGDGGYSFEAAHLNRGEPPAGRTSAGCRRWIGSLVVRHMMSRCP